MKKILIVEDNEKNMYLISFILKKNGYEVIEAVTGEQGVELAIKEKARPGNYGHPAARY